LIRRIPIIGAIAGVISPSVASPEAATTAPAAVAAPVVEASAPVAAPGPAPPPEAVAPSEPPRQKRRGIFGRIIGIFGGGSDDGDSKQQ
jgi:hypothetical protein